MQAADWCVSLARKEMFRRPFSNFSVYELRCALTFAVSGSKTLENCSRSEERIRCPLLAKRIVWFGSSSYTLYRGTLPWARPMALPRRYQYAPPPAGINGTTAQRSDDDGRRTHKELSRYLGEVSCSYCGARGALPSAPCGECALPYCSKQCLEEGRARHHRKLCDKEVSECEAYAARRGGAASSLALVERDRLAMAALLGQNTRLRLRGSDPIECIVCQLPRTVPPCQGFFFGKQRKDENEDKGGTEDFRAETAITYPIFASSACSHPVCLKCHIDHCSMESNGHLKRIKDNEETRSTDAAIADAGVIDDLIACWTERQCYLCKGRFLDHDGYLLALACAFKVYALEYPLEDVGMFTACRIAQVLRIVAARLRMRSLHRLRLQRRTRMLDDPFAQVEGSVRDLVVAQTGGAFSKSMTMCQHLQDFRKLYRALCDDEYLLVIDDLLCEEYKNIYGPSSKMVTLAAYEVARGFATAGNVEACRDMLERSYGQAEALKLFGVTNAVTLGFAESLGRAYGAVSIVAGLDLNMIEQDLNRVETMLAQSETTHPAESEVVAGLSQAAAAVRAVLEELRRQIETRPERTANGEHHDGTIDREHASTAVQPSARVSPGPKQL